MKIAVAPLGKRASTGAPGARVATLSRFPASSENTMIGTGPEFVPRTVKAPACPPPSRNALPGSIVVLLVRDVQAATIALRATSRTAAQDRMDMVDAGKWESTTGMVEYSQRGGRWMQRACRTASWCVRRLVVSPISATLYSPCVSGCASFSHRRVADQVGRDLAQRDRHRQSCMWVGCAATEIQGWPVRAATARPPEGGFHQC